LIKRSAPRSGKPSSTAAGGRYTQLTFTGGEPTQRTDLVELIDYAQWHVTRLNTSGLNLTSSFCKELFDANLDGLQVTLYSQDAKIHENLVEAKAPGEKPYRVSRMQWLPA